MILNLMEFVSQEILVTAAAITAKLSQLLTSY